MAQTFIQRTVLDAERPAPDALFAVLVELFVDGVEWNWPAVLAGRPVRRVELPTYAFQRDRYWLDAPPAAEQPTLAQADRQSQVTC